MKRALVFATIVVFVVVGIAFTPKTVDAQKRTTAKQELLAAETDEDMDRALRKVHILCDG